MAFKFPYGAMQQLNLDWFIKQFQKLRADWATAEENIAGSLQDEIDRAEDALSDVFAARDTAVAAKDDAVQAKADALQASANAAQYWQNSANSASSAAGSAGTALQAAEDAETAETNAAASNTQSGVNKFMAEAWAVGTMNGTPVGSGTIQYNNNAKYYAQQASGDAAQTALDRAAVAQDKDDTDTIKDNANAAALRAEGWADGTQNGTPVTSESPYYENNAKYYKEAAEDVLESIPPDYTELADEVASQSEKIDDLKNVIDDIAKADYGAIPFTLSSGYIKYADGTVVSSSITSHTDYIDVSMYSYVKFKRKGVTSASPSDGMVFYDSGKNYISGSGLQTANSQPAAGYLSELAVVAVPQNAVYARFSAYTDTSTYGNFELYGEAIIVGEVSDLKEDISSLESKIAQKAELHSGYYIHYGNGEIKTSASRKYSEFPVAYGMQILYKYTEGSEYNFGLAFYDRDGIYISGNITIPNTTQQISVPENAVLCRATVNTIDDAVARWLNSAITNNYLELLDTVRIKNTEFTVTDNKYAYSSRATIASYTGPKVMAFPVFEGLVFRYKYLNNFGSNEIGLHFVSCEGAYVGGVAITGQVLTVTVPAGSSMCYATIDRVNQIEFINSGNSIFSFLSNDKELCGVAAKSEPLTDITDSTGMLDIFLNVGCIGDSLASGESYWNDGGSTQGSDFYQYSWGQYLARKTGNKYYNFSGGGESTESWLESEYATECFDGEHLCEAYIIGLGQNDANGDFTIGTSADINLSDYTQNANTFYGNYGKIIQKIKEVQPQAKIFVITDPNDSTDNKGYNVAIRAMATIFDNVYVVDMRTYGLKYYKATTLLAQMRAGHYNAYGYKVFSMMIANYIDWIVTTNYTEFTQVELIGTGHSWT